jgi:hypothetical protein
MIKEEDESNSWNYSYAPAMRPLWSSDDRNVPGVWLSVERKTPRKKMKKRKDKVPSFGFQEKVSLTFVITRIILGCTF